MPRLQGNEKQWLLNHTNTQRAESSLHIPIRGELLPGSNNP